MRTPIVVGTLLASLSAAASPAPIIGGSLEAGEPAVVMLAAYPSDHSTLFTCTAVVIAPRALLTAAHCVDHPGFTFGVFYGADATPFDTLDKLIPQLAAVSAVHPHPSYSPDPPTFNADIAVVNLAADVPSSITPLQINRTPPVEAMVGLDVKIIGYGQTTFGQNNSAKYSAITQIFALDPDDTILIGSADARTCVGDSGGPALLSNVVLGVDSYSDTTGCGDPAHFRRTDAYVAFIDQEAGTSPPPPPPPDEDPPVMDEGGGGCAAGGTPSILIGLALAGLLGRRYLKR